MVTNNMDKMQDLTIEEKLQNLYELQQIDTEIDKIRTLRGELPLEVQDLEDELAGLETRLENLKVELTELDKVIAQRQIDINTANEAIKKYSEQLDNVRNNREYDALTKEIEFQKLEIELQEKRIREAQKAKVEKNHEYIRYIIPKGTSMDNYTQTDIDLMMSHINSTAREILNFAIPYDMASIYLGKKTLKKLNFKKILPDNIILKPYLINNK